MGEREGVREEEREVAMEWERVKEGVRHGTGARRELREVHVNNEADAGVGVQLEAAPAVVVV